MKYKLSLLAGLGVLAGALGMSANTYAAEVGTLEDLTSCLDWNNAETVCTLTGDIELDTTIQVSKDVELNLNGHTIVPVGSGEFLIYYGNMNVTGTGTVGSTTAPSPFYVWGSTDASATNFSTLTLGENVTVKANMDNGWGAIIPNFSKHAYGAVVNINGAIEASSAVTINGNVQDVVENAPTINIGDTARIETSSHAIYAAGYGHWNIGAATITGGSAIGVKAGTFVFNETNVTATGEYVEPAGWGNGIHDSGAVIQIESHDGYADNISMTFNGGVYASANGNVFLEYKEKENTVNSVQSMTITGGTFVAGADKAVFQVSDNFTLTNFISGGHFSSVPAKELLAEGYTTYKYGTTEGAPYDVMEPIEPTGAESVFLAKGETLTAGDLYDETMLKYASFNSDGISEIVEEGEGTMTGKKAGSGKVIYAITDMYGSSNIGETEVAVYDMEIAEGSDTETETDEDVISGDATAAVADFLANGEEGDEPYITGEVYFWDLAGLKADLVAGKTLETGLDVEQFGEEGVEWIAGLLEDDEVLDENEKVAVAFSVNVPVLTVDGEGALGGYYGNLLKLSKAVQLEFEIPEEYREVPAGFTRTFYVWREHYDYLREQPIYTKLSSVTSDDMKTISTESDSFSAFIVTYVDVAVPNTGANMVVKDFVEKNSKVGVIVLAIGMMMLGYGLILQGKAWSEEI